LIPRLQALVKQAQTQNIGLTIDAEEADRLELSLEIIETVFSDPSLAGWKVWSGCAILSKACSSLLIG